MLLLIGYCVLAFGAGGTAVGFNGDVKDWLLVPGAPRLMFHHSWLWKLILLHLVRI